jgi:hypothetical protein
MYAITPAMRLVSTTKTPLRDLGCVKTSARCFHHNILRLNARGRTTFTYLTHERLVLARISSCFAQKFIFAYGGSGLGGPRGHVPILAGNAPSCHQSKNSPIVLTVFYNSDVQNPARLFQNLEDVMGDICTCWLSRS